MTKERRRSEWTESGAKLFSSPILFRISESRVSSPSVSVSLSMLVGSTKLFYASFNDETNFSVFKTDTREATTAEIMCQSQTHKPTHQHSRARASIKRTETCCSTQRGSTNFSMFLGFFSLFFSFCFLWNDTEKSQFVQLAFHIRVLDNWRWKRRRLNELTLFSLKFSSNCQHSSSILSLGPCSSSSSSSSSHPESFGHSQHSPSDGEPLELELEPGSVPESSSPPDKHFLSDFPSSRRFFVQRRGSSRIMTSSSLSGSSCGARLGQARGVGVEDARAMGFDCSIFTSTDSVFLFRFSIFLCSRNAFKS